MYAFHPLITKDAPSSDETSAWLSLDGIPKIQATNPKIMTVIKQEIQMIFPSALLERLASSKTLLVTFAPKIEKTATPRKLKTEEINAPQKRLAVFEATREKIAFGASVQPFIKTTAIDKKNAKKPKGVSKFDQKIPFTSFVSS